MTRIMGWLACVSAVVLLVVAMVTGTAPATAEVVAPGPAKVRVDHAWVRLAAVPGRPAAGYCTLSANSAGDVTGVASPLARVEMHAMSMAGGVMRMDRLPAVHVAPAAPIRFTPGGAHLMLFDVAASVRPGGTIPLIFTVASGGTVRVDAVVKAAGSDAASAAAGAMPGMKM